MLDRFTGNENLPNLYIKDVVVNSTEAKTGPVSFEVSLVAKDYLNSSMSTSWSTEPLMRKYLYGLVLVTDSQSVMDGLAAGRTKMDISALKKSNPEAFIEVRTFSITSMNHQPTKSPSQSISNLETRKNFNINNTTGNLAVFACFAVNMTSVMNKIGASTDTDMGISHGPVSSEKILSGGNIPDLMFGFQYKNGQAYSGPVHSHGNRIMEGSFHGATPHETLRPVSIPNVKIVNTRKHKIDIKKPITPNYKLPTFSDLYYTVNTDVTSLRSTFFINYNQILNKYSKFGHNLEMFQTLSSEMGIPIYENAISNMTVGIYKETVDVRDTGSIISDHNRNFKIKKREKLCHIRGSSGRSYEKRTSDNILKTRLSVSMLDQEDSATDNRVIASADLGYYDFDEKVIFLNLVEKDFDTSKNHHFRYSIEVSFVDNYKKFIELLLTKVQKHLLSLESYYYSLLNNKAVPTGAISTDAAALLTFKRITHAGEATVVDSDISKIVYSLGRSKPEGIMSFISDMKKLFYTFKNLYNVRTKLSYSAYDIPQKIYSRENGLKKTFKNTFKQIINSKEFETVYNFGISNNPDSDNSLVVGDLSAIATKTLNIKRKQRLDTTSTEEKAKNGTAYTRSAMTKSSAPYLSPVGVISRGREISLLDDKVGYKQINRFFANNFPLSSKTNFHFSPLLKSQIPANIPEKDIDYSNASEYVGDESPFLTTQESLLRIDKNVLNLNNTMGKHNESAAHVLKNHLNNNNAFKTYKNRKSILKSLNSSSTTQNIPNQLNIIKSTDRTHMINNISSSPIDKIQMPELSRKIDLDHFIIKEVMYMVGFMKDSHGNVLVNSPRWSRSKLDQVGSTLGFAKLEYWNNTNPSYSVDERLKFNISDKYFFTNSSAIFVAPTAANPISTDINNRLSLLYRPNVIEYYSTNPITQSDSRHGIFGVSLQTAQSPSPSQIPSPDQRVLETSRSRTNPRASEVSQVARSQARPATESTMSPQVTTTTTGGGSSGY